MMKIYKFLKSYYVLRLTGPYTQRVLNRALRKNIYIWDLKKPTENSMEFKVSKVGYSVIKDFLESDNVTLEVITYNGLDKVLKNLKKRWMFSYAAITVAICVLVSSSFIWEIDVPEVDYVTKDEVVNSLSLMGIKKGHLRKDIDYTAVSNALVKEFDSLMWANVELDGTRIKVTLVPREKLPEIIPKDVPADIVSKKDGYVREITAENGEKKVKVGDTVVKGQVLISGLVPSERVGTRYVHSIGSVIATTWTEEEKQQKLYKYEKEYSGNVIKKGEIEIPFLKIPLFFKKNIDFYNYDSIIKEKNILFLTYREYMYTEYTLKKVPISLDEAVKIAEDELKERIDVENADNIKTTYVQTDEETVLVRVLAECTEEIGEEKEIE